MMRECSNLGVGSEMFQRCVILLIVFTQVWTRAKIKVDKRPFQIMPIDVSVQAKVGPFNIFIASK